MFCRVKFTFVKGPCLDKVISEDFDKDATVSQMKQYLVQVHHACDPACQSLAFVWDEQSRKLTNDDQTVSSFGHTACITVNVIKMPNAPSPTAVIPVTASSVDTHTSSAAPIGSVEFVPLPVHRPPSLASTSSTAPAPRPSSSVADAFASPASADSRGSLTGSDIVIGSDCGILQAKMQLVGPEGSRLIKCFAACSLRDLHSVLVDAELMNPGQYLAKVGSCDALTPETPLASLNRSRLQIITHTPFAGAASDQQSSPAVTVAAAARSSILPMLNDSVGITPTLNDSVGIDAVELERRRLELAEDQRNQAEQRKRNLAAHEQERKDAALQKQMSFDKLIADNAKARNAASSQGAGMQITLGESNSAKFSKIRIGTAKGGVEVTSYDDGATLGTLRAVLVSRGLCDQDAPIILSVQQ
jgi:hypothetical protein